MSATRVRLVAPSGYPHDRAAMTRGVARLREAGCRVDALDVLERTELRYAGSDAERAADLNALATLDELPDVALAIRGGYGATRLLEHLHYDALRERLYAGMAANGITGELADTLYTKIASFAAFGFAESHAISFALLVYASS